MLWLWVAVTLGLSGLVLVCCLIRENRRKCRSCGRGSLQLTGGVLTTDDVPSDSGNWETYRCQHCGLAWRKEHGRWGLRLDRIELFEKTRTAFDRVFPDSHPNITCIRDYIDLLVDLARRQEQQECTVLTPDEEKRLRQVGATPKHSPGMLGGFAMHDAGGDNELIHLLCVAQGEAEEMKKELLGRK